MAPAAQIHTAGNVQSGVGNAGPCERLPRPRRSRSEWPPHGPGHRPDVLGGLGRILVPDLTRSDHGPAAVEERYRLMNRNPTGPAFLFDLDGTLVDSVYQHVLAWREALEVAGIELAVWTIHRRIGMSGGLLVNALLRETGRPLGTEEAANIQRWHTEAYARMVTQIRPLPGAQELLDH